MQVVEGYLQVVVMMLADSPHFGVAAQEELYACLCALVRSRHLRRVTVCVYELVSSVYRYL